MRHHCEKWHAVLQSEAGCRLSTVQGLACPDSTFLGGARGKGEGQGTPPPWVMPLGLRRQHGSASPFPNPPRIVPAGDGAGSSPPASGSVGVGGRGPQSTCVSPPSKGRCFVPNPGDSFRQRRCREGLPSLRSPSATHHTPARPPVPQLPSRQAAKSGRPHRPSHPSASQSLELGDRPSSRSRLGLVCRGSKKHSPNPRGQAVPGMGLRSGNACWGRRGRFHPSYTSRYAFAREPTASPRRRDRAGRSSGCCSGCCSGSGWQQRAGHPPLPVPRVGACVWRGGGGRAGGSAAPNSLGRPFSRLRGAVGGWDGWGSREPVPSGGCPRRQGTGKGNGPGRGFFGAKTERRRCIYGCTYNTYAHTCSTSLLPRTGVWVQWGGFVGAARAQPLAPAASGMLGTHRRRIQPRGARGRGIQGGGRAGAAEPAPHAPAEAGWDGGNGVGMAGRTAPHPLPPPGRYRKERTERVEARRDSGRVPAASTPWGGVARHMESSRRRRSGAGGSG